MKNIWILNHYASLNGHRHFELGKKFKMQGNKVVVIASAVNCPHSISENADFSLEQIEEGFYYVWLRVKPEEVRGSVQRILSMFSYVCLLKKHVHQLIGRYGKPDVVIASSVHPLVWEAAYYLKKKYLTKFICEIRDIWPVSIIEHMKVSKYHPVVIFFDIINRRAFRRCDALVATAKKVDQYIKDRYQKDVTPYYWIPNGYSTDDELPALPDTITKELAPLFEYMDSHWCMTYTGSVTKSEGVEYLVHAFREFQKQCDFEISLVIVGDGNCKKQVEELVKSQKILNVYMQGNVERKYIPYILRKSKICVSTPRITYNTGKYGLSMNKLCDYLWSGRPVLFAYDYFNVVKDADAGICVSANDIQQFINALRELYCMSEDERNRMGESGRKEILRCYDYNVLSKQYLQIIEEIVN